MSLFAPWFNVLEDLDYWPYSPDEDDKIAAEYARAAVVRNNVCIFGSVLKIRKCRQFIICRSVGLPNP